MQGDAITHTAISNACEGPIVDECLGFATRDTAVADTSRCDHIQGQLQCIREGKQWAAAVAQMREMQQWQMQGDAITYVATIISACEKDQSWMSAVALLREIQEWQMQADVITYSATISACERGQQWGSSRGPAAGDAEMVKAANVITFSSTMKEGQQ